MKTSRRFAAGLLVVLLTLETSVALAQTATTWGNLKSRYGTERTPAAGPGVTVQEARAAWRAAVRLNRYRLVVPEGVTYAGVAKGSTVFLVTGWTEDGDLSAQVVTSGGEGLAGAVLDLGQGALVDSRTGARYWKASTGDSQREFVDFTQSLGFREFAKRVVSRACSGAAGLVWGKCAAAAGPNIWGQLGCFVVFLSLLALCDLMQNVRMPDDGGCSGDGDLNLGGRGPTLCY